MKREFEIGDVLSVPTDKLVSLRHMDGVYDVLSFMLGRLGASMTIQRLPENIRSRYAGMSPKPGVGQ